MRQLFCLLLLICLPLQSFAMQLGGVQRFDAAGLSHEFEHVQDLHHHHEADGTVHYDDSEASIEHTDDRSPCSQHSLLKPSTVLFDHIAVSRAARADLVQYIPLPYLEEPQRPPSFAPGLAAGG